jgi:cobalt-zinc-cadmium efflux system outer membrane protein
MRPKALIVSLLCICSCHRPVRIEDPQAFLPVFVDRDDRGSPPKQIPTTLTSPEILRMATENHPDVIAARTKVEASEARVDAAGAWPNPELEGRVLFDGDGLMESEGALLFSLPLGNAPGARQAEALAGLDQARLDHQAAVNTARHQVELLFAQLAHARARSQLLADLAKKSSQYASLARSRQSSSMADPLEVALVLADAARDRRALARARSAIHTAEEELRLLLGLGPGQGDFGNPVLVSSQLVETGTALEQAAVKWNPQVAMSRLEVIRADRRAAVVASERWPDLRFGPAATAGEGSLGAGVQLGIDLPLLQSGSADYQEALADRQGAVSAYQVSVRRALNRVSERFRRLKTVQQEMAEQAGEVTSAVDTARALAEVRYQSGKLDVLRLLSVHRAFSALKLDQLDLLLRHREAMLDLQLAVGRTLKTKEVQP